MLKNFIWAVGVRPSLDFECTQAGLRINAQPLRGLPNRKCVPWERLEFRRRRTSAYDVIVGHGKNSERQYPLLHYANYTSVCFRISTFIKHSELPRPTRGLFGGGELPPFFGNLEC
jgi:hypothetical protein